MCSDRVMAGVDETARAEEAAARRMARIPDVARRAGVSTATVDRVLNRRPGVRAGTVQKVLQAVAELGYPADLPAPLLAPGLKPLRIVVLLPAGTNRFITMLGRMLAESTPMLEAAHITCRVEYIKSFNPELLARALLQHGRTADGLVFMALEHPAVREAVNRLAEKGVPCATLISDVAGTRRLAYFGLDNRSAGRTAAYLIARFVGNRPAKVAMIAGSLSYRAHEEREMGFLHLFQEMFPQIEVVGLREGQDDEAQNYRQTRQFLAQHPDLSGLYNIGGGAAGVGRALKETRRAGEVVFVGHGLTPDTRALLLDGTMDAVITQSPQGALASIATLFSNVRAGLDPLAGVEPPRIEIILRENLP